MEAAFGTPIDRILASADGPPNTPGPPQTTHSSGPLLVGGYFGRWVPAAAVADLRLANQSLASIGASVGAGALVALPGDACGLVETARVVGWLAGETAGQCGPCVFGLASIAAGLDNLVWGRQAQRTLADLGRWLTQVKGRGACHHPDGTARLVESCLDVFAAEIAAHSRQGGCPAVNRAPVLPIPTMSEGWR
jgi:NADH:ubiquinone oxidoreductase subunit F (NADH-binding)